MVVWHSEVRGKETVCIWDEVDKLLALACHGLVTTVLRKSRAAVLALECWGQVFTKCQGFPLVT
jgi:hypothetical protein